jgi:hypothetical protein
MSRERSLVRRIVAAPQNLSYLLHGRQLHGGGDLKGISTSALSMQTSEVNVVCRSIKTLFNFQPPVTEDEIRDASLQFVRKVSGFNKPSKANEAAFLAAVDEIAAVSANLLGSLETNAPPRNRTVEAAKAQARAAERFSR